MYRKHCLGLILGMTLLLSACQPALPETAEPSPTTVSATAEPSPTIDWFPRTPTPLPLASPTAEIVLSTRPSAEDQEVIATDDFSDESLWETSASDAGTVAYAQDGLTLAVAANGATLVSLSEHVLPGDFYLEISLDTLMCSPKDQYGLILWNNSQSGTFRLWLNCEGKIKLDRVLPSGISQLVKWQTGRRLQPGSPAEHRLTLVSKDGTLEVYVEETLQFSYALTSRPEGALGVIAQTSGELPMTLRVSELEILVP